MRTATTLLATAAALALGAGAALAETVVIGHFGNPTPMQYARATGAVEAATGWDVEWRQFGSGTEVIAAMASGDIVLSELGSSPLAIAASQGVDLQLFMISEGIGTAESLIAKEGSGIASVADLVGKRVAVPVGSTAHYSLMGALAHEGISEGDITIVNLPADQIAAAWDSGQVDAAWIWQPVQSQILQSGSFILGADETAAWGYPTYDGWVVDRTFLSENMDAVVAFAKAIDAVNQEYLADPAAWTAESDQVQQIAQMTGADPAQVPDILKGFIFVPLAEQLGDTWLGDAANKMKATADFLVQAGRIDAAVDDYASFVNTDVATAGSAQ